MKPSTHIPISHERLASAADITTVSTATIPKGTSAVWISVETTNARVTFDGTNPGTGGVAPSNVIPKDSPPQLFTLGSGTTIKYVSTAAAVSVMQLFYVK